MTDCKYYDEESCTENCTEDWVKCDICKKYLDFVGDDYEPNGYAVYNASMTCDDCELNNVVMRICPKCFEKIKEESK